MSIEIPEEQIKAWREEFESQDNFEMQYSKRKNNSGEYFDDEAHHAWMGYRAARKNTQEEIEMYKDAFTLADEKWQSTLTQAEKLQERISFLEECNERQKTYYDENIELRYQLNNSMNYHCPHFLSNESGTVSCHVDFISQIEKRDQLIEQVYPWIKDPSAIPFVRVRLQWIKQIEELKGEK